MVISKPIGLKNNMDVFVFAPVVVFAYNRPMHLDKMLISLSQNEGASSTDIFIYVDGPATASEYCTVDEVRSVARRYVEDEVFGSVTVTFRNTNMGLKNSVICGVTDVIEKYGMCIVLEDDLVLSKGCLMYLNRALRFYEDNPSVFSVTAFNYPPKILNQEYENSEYNNYFIRRPCSWAWGTWRSRWKEVKWEEGKITAIISDTKKEKEFSDVGADLPFMLKLQLDGYIDSWAVIFSYYCFMTDSVCSYPQGSFVNNIGSDGSGTHKGKNASAILNEELKSFEVKPFSSQIDVDYYAENRISNFASKLLVYKKVIHWLRLYPLARLIRKAGHRIDIC